ncbi:MAG: hypothetical protein JJLCMIEE_01486 [Acidimicrobiales bacterium]|nr:MAG: hypothetical protein EDR02_06300 [Actinomycetota bacterium]MBV6508424.1 hypothetical protein [Acidimicrobiales bacterium]RIK04768.1 MAG: hypothetical protein DCC48_11995 [Acidobacteriota bacterium]
MVSALWTAKGGAGATVTAACLALVLARDNPEGSLVIDLGGDLPAVFGLPDSDRHGVTDWLAVDSAPPADALARLEIPVATGLSLVARGTAASWPRHQVDLLTALLAEESRAVVIDVGLIGPEYDESPDSDLRLRLAGSAEESLLVTRPCYLALRRALRTRLRASGLIVIAEKGRALDEVDVEDVLDAQVRARIDADPAVARAVDAGLLSSRLPRSIHRALREVHR